MAALSVLLASVASLALAAGSACDGDCAGTYDKCIGRDIFSLKDCCSDKDHCVKFSKWYGQCRPKNLDRFDDDWLGVTVDCNLCGVDTKQTGEFNYDTSIYCDIRFLGSLTLDQCANACGSGDYVACDRYITDPDTPASCYGYFELFEGGCFMRNDSPYYESWLTCPQGNTEAAVLSTPTDDAPAALDAETLEADIAADEAATDGGALAQKKKDVAAAS